MKVDPSNEIGSNRDAALAIFLRACIYEPRIGMAATRKAVRTFLDTGNLLESLENLRQQLSARSRDLAEEEYEHGLSQGFKLISFSAPEYPPGLRDLPEPAPTLWLRGAPPAQQTHFVAIVGSRECSEEGEKFARALAANLSAEGVVVVSGFARGIDSAAHHGAILGAHARSELHAGIAILGSGLEVIYPASNRPLASELEDAGGCIVSEYRLNQTPHAFLFPDRNRLISAAASSVVVVEAGEGSGSLITARLACELGRDIFTVPGSIRNAKWKGSNELLRLGARVLLSPDELEEILPLSWRRSSDVGLQGKIELEKYFPSQEERCLSEKIANLCRENERDLDELARTLEFPPERLLPLLTRLEMYGVLVRGNSGGWELNVRF